MADTKFTRVYINNGQFYGRNGMQLYLLDAVGSGGTGPQGAPGTDGAPGATGNTGPAGPNQVTTSTTTTITGLLKGEGATVSAANAPTDYIATTDSRLSDTRTPTDASVTNAKLATMATKTYKGRTSSGTGVPEDVAVATLKTDLTLVKGDVGLGNVDNTADTAKPISTATQSALDAKQALDSDLTTIAGLTATTDNFMVAASSAWASRTPAQAKTSLALVKADVGLSSVDNTSDAGKPVSTAQQTALNLKADLASPTLTGTPLAPTAAAGTNTTQVATTAYAMSAAPNASYRTILQATGSHTAAKVGGTYALGEGDPLAVSGTGTLYPLAVIQLVAADYPTVNGLAPKLRLRFQLFTNDVAPTGNFTLGLYPITRPGTSGGAGLCIYTLGTVVAGSNGATFSAPAADLLGSMVGADFAFPTDGPYVLGIVTTATVATSAHVHVCAQLQIHNA
jgi:hypothetical protein